MTKVSINAPARRQNTPRAAHLQAHCGHSRARPLLQNGPMHYKRRRARYKARRRDTDNSSEGRAGNPFAIAAIFPSYGVKCLLRRRTSSGSGPPPDLCRRIREKFCLQSLTVHIGRGIGARVSGGESANNTAAESRGMCSTTWAMQKASSKCPHGFMSFGKQYSSEVLFELNFERSVNRR